MTKLDPRPAREGLLTSRECAKIVFISVRNLILSGYHSEEIRSVVSLISNLLDGDMNVKEGLDLAVNAEKKEIARIMSGCVSVIGTMAGPRELSDAVRWWSENDAAWFYTEFPIYKETDKSKMN